MGGIGAAVNHSPGEALDLAGIFVFAVSGALLAVRKDFDLVGMLVLAGITALGGGVVRDLVLGAVPPVAFTDPGYLLVPVLATAVVFVAHAPLGRLGTPILVFDAAGLGLFCVAGAAKALAYGLGPVQAVALGTITAIGGGVARDVLANEVPAVLRAGSVFYAIPAVLGATLVVTAQHFHLYGSPAAAGAAGLVFALRVLALRFGWTAPRPRPPADTTDD
jgi:uncharacterized membrane protein YeiH